MSASELSRLEFQCPWCVGGTSGDAIIKWRDEIESQRLLRDRLQKVFEIQLRDELFGKFQEFVHAFRQRQTGFFATLRDFLWRKPKVTFEEDQLRELWGVWVKQNLDDKFGQEIQQITEADQAKLAEENKKRREQKLQSFEEFLNEIKRAFDQDDLIKNPSFYLKRGQHWDSLEDLDRAINLAGPYSFAARYEKARMWLKHLQATDQLALQDAFNQLSYAKQSIQEFMIPMQEAFVEVVNLGRPDQNGGELAQKIQRTIKLYEAMVKSIDEAVATLEGIGKNTREGVIDYRIQITSTTKLEDASGGAASDPEKIELTELGVPNFFKITVYEIEEEEDDDWFGGLFSVFAGIFQIFAGVLLMFGGGIFLPTFGFGMLFEGIKDILYSVKSFITGEQINLDVWLKSKGIAYAINIITSGIQVMIDKLAARFPAFKNFIKKFNPDSGTEGKAITSETVIETVTGQLKKQGVIEGISMLGQLWAGGLLKQHREEIEDGVRDKVSRMIEQHRDLLIKIFMDQAFQGSQKTTFIHEAMRILKNYEERYQSAGAVIARGVAKRVLPVIGPAITAAEIISSTDKILDATSEFCNEFSNKISAWASETKPSGELFREKFIGYKILSTTSINSMMDTLTINGVIENQQLVCVGITKCGQIKHLKWEKDLRGYTHVMEDQCRKLCSIETADYSAEIEKFTGGLITLITNSIMRMIRGELIDPVSGVAAGFLYSLYEKQQLAQKSTEQELFEKAQKARLAELKTKKTSTKPTAESQPPLSKRDERAISHLLHRFETDIHTRHSTAKALSRVLNARVEIYENDLAYPLIYKPAGTNLNKAVRLKYDSVFNQWSTADAPYLRFDDIFEAAAATAKQHTDLQDLVAQEIRANPQLYLHAARDYLADFSYAKHHAESLAAFRVKTGAEDKWNEYAKSADPATALRESFDKYVEDQLKSARRMQEPAPDVSVEDWLKRTAQHKVSKGDTVEAIARKHGITVGEVVEANSWLRSRTKVDASGRTVINIKAGTDELVIPLRTPSEYSMYASYKIRSGESLTLPTVGTVKDFTSQQEAQYEKSFGVMSDEEKQRLHSLIEFGIAVGYEASLEKTEAAARNVVKSRLNEAIEAGILGATVGAELCAAGGPLAAVCGAAGAAAGGTIGYNKDAIIKYTAKIVSKFDKSSNEAETLTRAGLYYGKFIELLGHIPGLPSAMQTLRNLHMKFEPAGGPKGALDKDFHADQFANVKEDVGAKNPHK